MNLKDDRDNLVRKLQRKFVSIIYRNDLKKLATFYDADKWNYHWYAQHYQWHFAPLRLKKLKILEIGVGGYEDPQAGGESLIMWKDYFPNSMIYGIDIVDKKAIEEDRIKVFQGRQEDETFLRKVVTEAGKFDIIIDDGSHNGEHVIKSFRRLFPALNNGGFYAVEDTHSSYLPSIKNWSKICDYSVSPHWIDYGGSLDINDPKTSVNYFKSLVDCLSHQEILNPGYSPSYFDKNIVSIHFYRNLVVLHKGKNTEPGVVCENNTLKPEILKQIGIESLEELGLEVPTIPPIGEPTDEFSSPLGASEKNKK
jgi:hypothetical protein